MIKADPSRRGGTNNQDDATGYILLNTLRLKVAARVRGKK
jgi:hypothetical protein